MSDIIIKNLYKSFGDNSVLENVNITIKEGSITCIMGQSGKGKTTLLNILMGLEKADSGEILNMPKLKSAVFQENRLCESFSVLSNIRIVNDNVSDDTILSHLNAVGLKNEANQQVSTLSGGMKRRVALVRAIIAKKDILFLDEALKGLDENTKETTIQYILDNCKNTTVIMVTHQKDEALKLNANILYLKNGQITE